MKPILENESGNSRREEEEEDEDDDGDEEENMVENGDGNEATPHSHPNQLAADRSARKGGGWKTMPYIIGNETFEKLASMSLTANIVVYLRSQYNMDGLSAVTAMNVWSGTSNFAPLLGAFLSDSYFGRFWTLLGASVCSFLGMGIMTLTAAIRYLRPRACSTESTPCQHASKWQLGVLFTGLGFLAVGAGGIRPCNIAFGVDQFDTTTEKGRKQVGSFYNWYYWSFTLALIVALTGVVYVQSNISWKWGLAIPTALLALSILVFLLGYHVYVYIKPRGSVYVDLAKVIIAACRKRYLKIEPVCEYTLYDPPMSESDPTVVQLRITKRFSFLNKAAVITELDSFDDNGLPRNSWRLCSVHQVEHLKCILGVIPVWASGICCFIAMDQQTSQGVLQAIQMDTRLIHNFHVPPGSLNVIAMLALSVWIPIYERLVLPISKKMTKDGVGITLKHRFGAGIIMSILCMLAAGIVEGMRRASALSHHSFAAPMSFAWLFPQFILSGMTEAFTGIGMMEFLGKQFPSSLRTLAASLFFLSLSIASYLSSLLVNLIHRVSKRDGDPGWLGGRDLNRNKLDWYYYIVAGVCVLNLLYYTTYASHYVDDNTSDVERLEDVEMNQMPV